MTGPAQAQNENRRQAVGPPRDRPALRRRRESPDRRNLVRAAARARPRRDGQISLHHRAAVDPGPPRRRHRPARGHRSGKDECWIILDVADDAELGIGTVREASGDEVIAAAQDGSIVDLIDWRKPAVGDFLYNPAGTIHALGPGLTVLEIQQAVDLTYRLFDYGRPRELHLDESRDVVLAKPHQHRLDTRVGDHSVLLVAGPHFGVAWCVKRTADPAAGPARRAAPPDRRRGRRGRPGRMRTDRRPCRAPPAQRRQVRPRLVAGNLTKVYFDGGCRPNPGPISVAAVLRGEVHLRADLGEGSSGDAEWLALLHALEVASAAGERDVLLLGDSASVIDQANGKARMRVALPLQQRFAELVGGFDRVRFRRIKRNQNLAGIALEQARQRSTQP